MADERAENMISTLHKNNKINSDTGKPEMIMFYNKTKGDTDTFDQLTKTYTTARVTNVGQCVYFMAYLIRQE